MRPNLFCSFRLWILVVAYIDMAYIVMVYIVMRPYLSCSFCLWIVEPFSPQRDIALRFEQFELESGFDFLKV